MRVSLKRFTACSLKTSAFIFVVYAAWVNGQQLINDEPLKSLSWHGGAFLSCFAVSIVLLALAIAYADDIEKSKANDEETEE